MLLNQWSNQSRYLTFENFALPVPEKVSTSLPQGDPWSMLGMVALLTPAIWEISRKHPNVLHRTFVDDRSWAADTVQEARDVETIWKSWSSILQLQENNAKSQYFHARESGRQNFIDSGVNASQVSHDIVILGYAFRGFRQRKLTRNEDDRVNKSVALIRKATYLPVLYSMKKRIIAAAPLAKVEFGWLMKVPPLVVCNKVQKAIKQALHEPQNSSPDLRSLEGTSLEYELSHCYPLHWGCSSLSSKDPCRYVVSLASKFWSGCLSHFLFAKILMVIP